MWWRRSIKSCWGDLGTKNGYPEIGLWEHIDGDFCSSRVRERRKYYHKTQKQLAAQLGISQSVICEYETRKSTPSLKMLSRLAVVLCTSTDYLLGLTDDPCPAFFKDTMIQTERDFLQAYGLLCADKATFWPPGHLFLSGEGDLGRPLPFLFFLELLTLLGCPFS